jgi:hypothetical protein
MNTMRPPRDDAGSQPIGMLRYLVKPGHGENNRDAHV